MDKLAKRIVKREKALRDSKERQNFEEIGAKIGKYFVPHRDPFVDREGKESSEQARELYDTTGADFARTAAEGTHGHLISPRTRWMRLRTGFIDGETVLDDVPEVANWLEEIERIEYKMFARSNFYSAMSQILLDGWTIGTAVGGIEWNWQKMIPVFYCYSPGEMVIAENAMGEVDTVYRKFQMTLEQASDKFEGIFDGDSAMLKRLEDNPDAKINFIHAVYPRRNRKRDSVGAKNKAFASVYVWTDAPGGNEKIVKESGYDYFPYLVWRFSKVSGDVYGRSPAWTALWDVMFLNVLKKGIQYAVQLGVDPMWAVPQEWEDTWRVAPGAEQYYGSDPNRRAYPMYANSMHTPYSLELIQDVREAVGSHFRVQYFMMMQSLDKEMTAFEVQERNGEKATLLGPSIGRLTTELLGPIMDILFEMLVSAHLVPETPAALVEYAGADLTVEFVGPLLQTQERFITMQPIKTFLSETLPMVEVDPSILDNYDMDTVVREIHRATGAPVDVLNDTKEVEEVRKARAEQQAQQEQLQAQMVQAEMISKVQK